MKELHLNNAHWEVMHRHVAACAPQEACGLLAGLGNTVDEVMTITNQLRSQTRFRMEPSEQIRAFAAIEQKGLELIGIFHSHPAIAEALSGTSTVPSTTDIAEAAYPVAHVVWSRPQGLWMALAYWIESGAVADVVIKIDHMK